MVANHLASDYEKKCKNFLLSIEEHISQKWPVKLSKISINNGAHGYYGAIPLFIHVKVYPSFKEREKVTAVANLTMGTEENCLFQSEWIFDKNDFNWTSGKEIADLIFENISKKIPRFISTKLI